MRPTRPWALWAAIGAFLTAVVVISFNPYLMPLVLRATNSYEMINRSGDPVGALSDAILLALEAAVFCIPLYFLSRRRLIGLLPLALVAVFGVSTLMAAPYPALTSAVIANRGWYPSLLDAIHDPLYTGMSRLDPGNVAVAQDQAEMLAALTPHHVLAVREFWMGDFANVAERQSDNRQILAFDLTVDQMRRLLTQYDCRYVVVSAASASLGRFRSTPDLFVEVVHSPAYVVFAATRAGIPGRSDR